MENEDFQPGSGGRGLPGKRGSFWDIFLEPSRAFESINWKPAFVIPLILCILVSIATSYVIYSNIDMAKAMRAQIESSPAAGQLSQEQIDEQVAMAVKFGRISALAAPIVMVPLLALLIAGLIMLGIYVTGSEIRRAGEDGTRSQTCPSCGKPLPPELRDQGNCPYCGAELDDLINRSGTVSGTDQALETTTGSGFSKALSVSVASIFFYTVVSGILTIAVILAASDPNQINIRNPVFTNPAGLVDMKESKVLYNFLSHLDILVWYTIFLMGLGISKIAVRCSVAKGVMIIGFWYLLYALIQTGLSALF